MKKRAPLKQALFELLSTRALRRRGIGGRSVWIALGADVLTVTGRDDRALDIPLAGIRRILVGREPARSTDLHRLQIWTADGGSIVLRANAGIHDMASYAAMVRALARSMAERDALDAVRIGLPRLSVFGLPVLVCACLTFVALAAPDPKVIARMTAREAMIGGLLIVSLALVTTGWTLRQGIHRRLRSLSDLDRILGKAAR